MKKHFSSAPAAARAVAATLAVAATFAIAVLAGCAGVRGAGAPGGSLAASGGADEQEVREAVAAFVSALNRADYGNASRHLAPDFTQFVGFGRELVTPAAMMPGDPMPDYSLRLGSFEVSASDRNAFAAGYLYGQISLGGELSRGPWGFSFFWVKSGSVWKMAHAHTSEIRLTSFRRSVTLPEGCEPGSPKRWPMILFLHGAGERGDEIDLVKKNGVPKIAERDRALPFITVSPQCPDGTSWPMLTESLDALLDEVISSYPIDAERIYLTGLSMGGFGTWYLAAAHPERFAAVAPVSGIGDVRQAARIARLPVWAFHGEYDPFVPVEKDREMVDAVKRFGGEVRFTVYADAGHDIWDRVYDSAELYAWFLRHKRSAE